MDRKKVPWMKWLYLVGVSAMFAVSVIEKYMGYQVFADTVSFSNQVEQFDHCLHLLHFP